MPAWRWSSARSTQGEKIEKLRAGSDPVLITNDNLKTTKGWTSR